MYMFSQIPKKWTFIVALRNYMHVCITCMYAKVCAYKRFSCSQKDSECCWFHLASFVRTGIYFIKNVANTVPVQYALRYPDMPLSINVC